jgi:transposase-like protein
MVADPSDIRFQRRGSRIVVGSAPPRVRRRFEDTRAFEIYQALEEGGDLTEIAARFQVPPSVLRQHIKVREESGKWRFDVTAWYTVKRSGRKVYAAGKLRRL